MCDSTHFDGSSLDAKDRLDCVQLSGANYYAANKCNVSPFPFCVAYSVYHATPGQCVYTAMSKSNNSEISKA